MNDSLVFKIQMNFLDFLGRTEVKLVDIQRDVKATKGPITKRLLLHEVDAGEVLVNLHLQLFDNTS